MSKKCAVCAAKHEVIYENLLSGLVDLILQLDTAFKTRGKS